MRRARRRAGFTLLELLIVVALLAIVTVKVTLVLREANEKARSDTAALALEDQAQRVLDQIAFAIMGSDRDTLFPDTATYTTELNYLIHLGVEDGEIVVSDPERIGLGELDSQVVWRRNPELPEERRVVWCNLVRPMLEGEVEANGVDDNENGLVDEAGLAFELVDDMVVIRMTLERLASDGTRSTRDVETRVTCRN